ncbi:MAG TPA: class I tRNA ligase family protein, partial [Chthoniobacterales bacterium]|nr:class I tRNA ligase family protein [Chthoniobacterales bacterium]
IPAWYRGDETRVQLESPGGDWQQDPDTLDTWFSSWLWAYETMDEETRRKFYPTAALVTGPDIIFFWVARMIIAGLEFQPGKSERIEDNIPFRDVFLTGLIRDKQGRKMSKSLGNSPDPLDLIGKYGADGLRFGLMRIAPIGQDIGFDEKQIEEGRNFATKLWNAARFRQMHGPSQKKPQIDEQTLSIYAVEVLARFNELLIGVEAAYREYKFNEVAQRLYDFFWGDYCDWFVEAAKTDIFAEDEARKKSVLAVMDFVLSGFLRLLHPFMPHITEELWSLLGFGHDSTVQFAEMPGPALGAVAPQAVATARETVAAIYGTVQMGRNLRATSRVPSNKKTNFVLRPVGQPGRQEVATMSRLLNAEELKLDPEFQAEAGVPVVVAPLGELYLIVATADKAAERQRLDKEIARLEGELRTVHGKLSNESFVERAPAAVVEEHRKREADFTEQLSQLQQARAAMD